MRRVLVAGCGDVGTRLAVILARRGCEVWGLRRHPGEGVDGITSIAADLNDPSTLRSLPPELDTVYYTAAADRSDLSAYQRAYVEGLDNLLRALSRQGRDLPRLLFTSSTSVYGQTNGDWIDEESSTEPLRFSGQTLLAAEELLASSGFSSTVVRLSGIYGPGRNRLTRLVQSGEASCVEGIYGNRIHADDAAGFLAHLGDVGDAAPLYLGVDDDPAPICDVLTWLAKRLDCAAPRVLPSEAEKEEGARGNKRCSNRRLKASGYRLLYPTYREGYNVILNSV